MLRGPDQTASRSGFMMPSRGRRGGGDITLDQLQIELLQPLDHGATPGTDAAAVDLGDRSNAGVRSGDECLLGRVDFGQAEVFLARGDAVLATELQHIRAGDSGETVIPARGPHLAVTHDEEMRRVAGRNEAVRIEHERFVRPGLGRLDAGGDAIELGMRVELRILNVRDTAADMHREEPYAL